MTNGKRKPSKATGPVAVAKRQRLPNRSTVDAYLRYRGGVVKRRVFSVFDKKKVLDWIPEEIFQHLTRDLINRVDYRWGHDLPIGSLDPAHLRVEDNALVLPAVGSGPEDRDYAGRTRSFVVRVFGGTGSWKDLDDFLSRLSIPGLRREQFTALYFHRLLQNKDQRAVVPVEFVDKMRNRLMTYNGTVKRWEAAYNEWEQTVYPEKIDLEQACSKDPGALKVFKHMTTYNNTPASRVKLARNIIIHLNDYRIGKKQSIYTPYELGALVDELFPNLSSRLFEFLWKQRISLDFKRSRNTFNDHYLKTQNKKKLNWRHGTDGRVCSSSVIKLTSSGFAEDQLDWVKLPAK